MSDQPTISPADNPEDLLGNAPGTWDEPLSKESLERLEVPALDASMSAIGSSRTERLAATASAVGIANVTGPAELRASAAAVLVAKGGADLHQSYAKTVFASQDVSIRQGGAAVVWAREASVKRGGAGIVVASQAKVKRGFVGMVLGRDVTVSDDSRVLISQKAALVVAAGLLGGFALVAVALVVMAARAAEHHRGRWERLGGSLRAFGEELSMKR